MGRSYWFECSRCGYRARVSGRADRGIDFFVQTILCRDCKHLYDAVTRIRAPGYTFGKFIHGPQVKLNHQVLRRPPSFQNALSRLPVPAAGQMRWINFPVQCPVSPIHRVQNWNDPDKCPRCGIHLEKNALPYRIWE
jgi:hypothetical protein